MSSDLDSISIVISLISAIISAVSAVVLIVTLFLQRKFNRNNVRPIINVIIGDYEDDIYVKLVNNGIGPAIITALECEYYGDVVKKGKRSSLIGLLNENGTTSYEIDEYTTFDEDIKGRTISPKSEIILVQLNNPSYNVQIRLMLKDIVIRVYYKDIYNQPFKEERKLVYFGRSIIY